MKVVLLAEAQRRFAAEDAWWRSHRDEVDLFMSELEHTLERIAENPAIGRVYRRGPAGLILRVLMPRTRCHVYCAHHPGRDLVEVHTIWGAQRGRGPAL